MPNSRRKMDLDEIKELLEQIPNQPDYEGDGFLMDLESVIVTLLAKLEAMERAAFKLHEGVERFTVTNAELSDEMYILRLAIGYDRMSQLRAAAQQEQEDE